MLYDSLLQVVCRTHAAAACSSRIRAPRPTPGTGGRSGRSGLPLPEGQADSSAKTDLAINTFAWQIGQTPRFEILQIRISNIFKKHSMCVTMCIGLEQPNNMNLFSLHTFGHRSPRRIPVPGPPGRPQRTSEFEGDEQTYFSLAKEDFGVKYKYGHTEKRMFR